MFIFNFLFMKIVEVKHPLIKHKIGLMRAQDISTKDFRDLAKEIGSLLTYEATADMEMEKTAIKSWSSDAIEVEQIKGKKITIVPILRAGLGMMDGVLEHIPSARISVVGIYRDEKTLKPVPYFQKNLQKYWRQNCYCGGSNVGDGRFYDCNYWSA